MGINRPFIHAISIQLLRTNPLLSYCARSLVICFLIMASFPSNSGRYSSVNDDLRNYSAGTSDLSPLMDSIPPEFVLLNWDDVALFHHPLPHHIPQTSAQTLGPGYTSPYDNQPRTLCQDTEAPTDGELSDFNSHGSSNIKPQLAGQSDVLGPPSEPYTIDSPVQALLERPHIPHSASNPRRRRAAPRSKAQENRYQTRFLITKCTS